MEPIRILIADDHPVFRFGLRALLASEPDLEVVGEVASGEQAIAQTEALQPDVVLMDVNMPETNGIEATRAIGRTSPRVAVLALTMLEDDETVFQAMRAGARGYLLKGAGGTETLHAIRTVAGGGAIFSPAVAERVLRAFTSPPAAGRAMAQPFPELTERERDVLQLIAHGLTNAAIAERLTLGPKTVRNYVSNVLAKLQVADRTEAALRAREAGLQ